MPYALKGRNILVTGGSRGLGALIVEKFAAEGCNVAINYNTSEARAKELAEKITRLHQCKVVLVKGDQGILEDCEGMVQKSIEELGGLDIIISNAGWTKLSYFGDLDALSESEWDKAWAVNCKGNLHLFRKALPTLRANPEGGVYIMTSSVAGIEPTGSSMAYSVTKAAGLHLMKSLASTQGPNVRVNAVLPGLLLTEWTAGFGSERIADIKEKALLKKETNLDDCADAFISLAKNSSMTGQSIVVDSGAARLR